MACGIMYIISYLSSNLRKMFDQEATRYCHEKKILGRWLMACPFIAAFFGSFPEFPSMKDPGSSPCPVLFISVKYSHVQTGIKLVFGLLLVATISLCFGNKVTIQDENKPHFDIFMHSLRDNTNPVKPKSWLQKHLPS